MADPKQTGIDPQPTLAEPLPRIVPPEPDEAAATRGSDRVLLEIYRRLHETAEADAALDRRDD